MSIRDNLQAAVARRFHSATVPTLGDVRIQSLSEFERAEIEERGQKTPKLFNCYLMIGTLVDDDGDRVLSEGDIEWLKQLDSRVSTAIVREILAHCGQPDEIETIEDLVKNLNESPVDVSQST